MRLLSDTSLPLTDIALDVNGALYGVDIFGNIFTLDQTDGSSSPVFSLPPPAPGSEYNSLTIDHESILYITGIDGNLYFYDLINEISGLIADLNVQVVGDMLFMDRENLLMLISGNRLYRYNIATNQGEIVTQLPSARGTLLSTVTGCNTLSFSSLRNDRNSVSFSEFNGQWADQNACNIRRSNRLQIFGATTNTEALNRTLIILNSLSVSNIICNRSLGAVQINAEGGYQGLTYALDSMDFQPGSSFSDLEIGNHTVYINDAKDCPISADFSIQVDRNLSFEDIEIIPSDCDGRNGSLRATLPSMNENLDEQFTSYLLFNSIDFGNELELVLDEGKYTLSNFGCGTQVDTTIIITTDPCGFYVPNALSTLSTAQDNNKFSVQFENPETVQIEEYQIYDEWGSMVYERNNFAPTTDSEWWNGTCEDKRCERGVYVYKLSFDLGRNIKRSVTGSLLLID